MSTPRCIPASLAPRAKRDSKRSPSGSKHSRAPRNLTRAGFKRDLIQWVHSQIDRTKSEGGLTRVAPLGVEAALSSERSICGAFARLLNKQDCRQSYYREECYETHDRSRTRGFSPGDTGG